MRCYELKNKIKNDEMVVGTFMKSGDPAIAEILGLSGLDFIVVDNEHVALDNNEIKNIIRGAQFYGMAPIIRVTTNESAKILHALDAGAQGVQVPNIDTEDHAINLEKYTKYYPIGKRGFSPGVRAAEYGNIPIKEYIERANKETLVVSHCESVEGYKNLDNILKIDSIDVVFIGPMDLSQSFGVVGEVSNQLVQDAIVDITKKSRAAGKAVGIATTLENVKKYYDLGIRYMLIGTDHGAISSFFKNVVKTSKKDL